MRRSSRLMALVVAGLSTIACARSHPAGEGARATASPPRAAVATPAPAAEAGVAPAGSPPPGALAVGQEAPQFTLPGTEGTVALAQFRGRQSVIVAFFPRAFTPG